MYALRSVPGLSVKGEKRRSVSLIIVKPFLVPVYREDVYLGCRRKKYRSGFFEKGLLKLR